MGHCELRIHGVLGSRVSCSALSTATIDKHELGINRGVAPPRSPARQPTRRMPRSTAQGGGGSASPLLHDSTRWRATKHNISPLPRSGPVLLPAQPYSGSPL